MAIGDLPPVSQEPIPLAPEIKPKGDDDLAAREAEETKQNLRTILTFGAVVCVVLTGFVVLGRLVLYGARDQTWLPIAKYNFLATIGLALAAVFALMLVLVMEKTSPGEIDVKMPGFEFRGPAGPIIMWVICFLAIAGAGRLCWQTIPANAWDRTEAPASGSLPESSARKTK